jgi:hypothetical protein
MIPPTLPIQIVLEARQWNTVMEAVQELPWRTAAPIVEALLRQFQAACAPGDPPIEPASGETAHVSH